MKYVFQKKKKILKTNRTKPQCHEGGVGVGMYILYHFIT